MATAILHLPNEISYDYLNQEFTTADTVKVTKYYKGIYDKKWARFKRAFQRFTDCEAFELVKKMWDKVDPFTYKEVFDIEDESFQRLVFDSINITDMITNLGSQRYTTDGKQVNRKIYDDEGNFLRWEEKHVIYEVHEVDGTDLGANENLYVLKCWCTTTNEEHWLWIESDYKDDPLEAVASTCRVKKNVIPYIKEIKRQGDIFIFELTEKVEPDENEPYVPLSKDKYFEMLTCET